jgi:hypothetical protein
MALAALDHDVYIEFIAECGQALIAGQCKDGRWQYALLALAGDMETQKPKIRSKFDTPPKIKLAPNKKPSLEGGDNSNSQYAALGLRTCIDAGIELPQETIKLALNWWEKSQFSDGPWEYNTVGGGVGTTVDPSTIHAAHRHRHSMTVGGISSVAIYKYILGQLKNKEDFAKDQAISAGLKWLEKNYKFQGGGTNHGTIDGACDYYYFYGLERAGILTWNEKIGTHDWYKEGAAWLVANQQSNGKWGNGPADTVFAILFLKRATTPLGN